MVYRNCRAAAAADALFQPGMFRRRSAPSHQQLDFAHQLQFAAWIEARLAPWRRTSMNLGLKRFSFCFICKFSPMKIKTTLVKVILMLNIWWSHQSQIRAPVWKCLQQRTRRTRMARFQLRSLLALRHFCKGTRLKFSAGFCRILYTELLSFVDSLFC